MQARGEYDCVVFGDGPEALFSAFLLVLNGERVVVVRASDASLKPALRFMPGFDPNGIFQFFLHRWGMKKIPPIESTSGVLKVLNRQWVANLREDLKRKELGGLFHEAHTPRVKKLIECLHVFEKDHAIINRFLKEFSSSLIQSQEKHKKYLPSVPIQLRWKNSLKKALKDVKLSSHAQVSNRKEVNAGLHSREALLFDTVHGLFRQGRTRGKGTAPSYGSQSVLGSALELYTLRMAPFALDRADVFCAEMRRILESKGVLFIGDAGRVNFKQEGAGGWDGFYAESGSGDLSHIRFQHFIIAHNFKRESLKHFDEKSRKKLESEFVESSSISIEYSFRVRSQDLPELKTGEYVYGEVGAQPIFVSLTEKEGSVLLSVKTEVVCAQLSEIEALLARSDLLKIRLRKKMREIFPSLLDSKFLDESFHLERVEEFAPGRGINTRMRGVWSAGPLAFPEMGSFSSLLASIEITRRFVRHRKRELVL